jgi:DNA polymerase-3 subunit gamma/tau
VSYQVFARKYRPQTFDTVVGQDHVTRTLKNAILQQRLAHAYLFVGPRGTGKTSTARILARSLNCVKGPTVTPCGECSPCIEIAAGRSLDVLEFDAASNTQVDKVRELIIETVQYAPASGRYKMYIVDEVHMLSNASFNALLKTLEEPPSHVIFVFATTEVNKVPLTIISRCQRFDLRRIPTPLIARSLLEIAGNESIELVPEAADAIARGAEGGMRDATSMLDQLVAFCGKRIVEDDVLSVFGFTSRETMFRLADAILDRDCSGALAVLHEQSDAGRDIGRLMADFIAHLRNLLVARAGTASLGAEMSQEDVARVAEQSGRIDTARLLELVEWMSSAESRMRWAPNKRLHFDLALIRAIEVLSHATLDEVLTALGSIKGGVWGAASGPVANESGTRPASAPKHPAANAPIPEQRPASRSAEKSRPAPEPAPAQRPPSAGTPPPSPLAKTPPVLDLATVWRDLVVKVGAERPLIEPWLQKGALVSFDGRTCVLAFLKTDEIAYESISRPTQHQFLEETLSEMAGGGIELRIEKRDAVERQAVSDAKKPEEIAPGDPADDPLIQSAIRAFEAEIARTPPKGAGGQNPAK